MLLCGQHHRLVHEGGFSIVLDSASKPFFRRPDGKAVPECGYRQEDWQDDSVYDAGLKNSAECSGVRESMEDYLVAA